MDEKIRNALDALEERVAINEAGLEAAIQLAGSVAGALPSEMRKLVADRFERGVERTLASMLADPADRLGVQYNRLEALRTDLLAILRRDDSSPSR